MIACKNQRYRIEAIPKSTVNESVVIMTVTLFFCQEYGPFSAGNITSGVTQEIFGSRYSLTSEHIFARRKFNHRPFMHIDSLISLSHCINSFKPQSSLTISFLMHPPIISLSTNVHAASLIIHVSFIQLIFLFIGCCDVRDL